MRVLALCGRVGRAGLPGALWCASPFPLAALSFCFAWPPPGWGGPPLSRCPCRSSLPWRCALVVSLGLPLPGSSCARASFVSPAGPLAALCPPPPSPFVSRGFLACLVPWCFFFLLLLPLCAPVVSGFLWFPAPGALGLGAVRCLLCWPSASWLSVRLSLFRAFRLAVGCSLVLPEHVPALPEHVPVLPEHVPVLAEHVLVLPEHVPLPPEHVRVLPEHVPVLPEHVPALPEHVPALSEHVPVLPEHVAVLAEHVPVLPEHVPALPNHGTSRRQR